MRVSAHSVPGSVFSGPSLRRGLIAGPIPAQLMRIVDGDTFEARVRVWFGQEITTLVRVRGFDAAELRGHCLAEQQQARQASEQLADFLADSEMELRDVAPDKFGGRVLASVWITDSRGGTKVAASLSDMMLATSLVRPYQGGKRAGWCNHAVAED